MTTPLRVLIVEDRAAESDLMLHELRLAGFEPDWLRVETEEGYLAALNPSLDVVLADYAMPQFDVFRALDLLHQCSPDIPMILVTGSVSEELAVEAMRHGVADYILQDRLARLGPAVKQALQERQLRESHRQAEAALSAAEQRLQHVVSCNPTVLFTMAIENELPRPTWLSDNVREMTGFAVDEVVGTDWWRSRIHPEDVAATDEKFPRELLARGRTTLKYRFQHRDGSYRWLRSEMRLLRDATGQPLEIVGSNSDITEHRQLEEQLRQAQKMEAAGRLAGGVAHDFNNLLTIICGYCDLVHEQLGEDHPLRNLVKEITLAGERASGLTRQLLAFSRKQVVAPVVLDLNRLIADIEKMLRRLIGEDVELLVRKAPDLWKVIADSGQIEQVLMNLVVNARDAMPNGGKLTIETANIELDDDYVRQHTNARAGSHVVLTVRDTGCGMDDATQARIFEPFFTTKGDKGTGLGLATVFGIVTQAGGHIELHSEPNHGTTFRIFIPADCSQTSDNRSQPTRRSNLNGTETVLLVEDEDSLRRFARLALETHGYTVLEAPRVTDALRLSEEHPREIDLLVTDVVMPGLNGRQLAERLQAQRPDLRVLYMSGYTDDEIVRHGILYYDTPFLQKPFTAASLAQKVREVLASVSPNAFMEHSINK